MSLKGNASPLAFDNGELLKFGKRMLCDNKITNKEILDDHLRQMREMN
jgi:hypothetical protein